MRSFYLALTVVLLGTASTASAQSPVLTPDHYLMNRPTAQPWNGGGFDPKMGYWIHGGLPDGPSDQWAVRAYTPVTANGYWLSQPPNTGFVMGYPGTGYPAASAEPCTTRRGVCRR